MTAKFLKNVLKPVWKDIKVLVTEIEVLLTHYITLLTSRSLPVPGEEAHSSTFDIPE